MGTLYVYTYVHTLYRCAVISSLSLVKSTRKNAVGISREQNLGSTLNSCYYFLFVIILKKINTKNFVFINSLTCLYNYVKSICYERIVLDIMCITTTIIFSPTAAYIQLYLKI